MTKERNDGISDPEEAYPIGEDGVQADEDTESPANENVESQMDKPEHSLFESGGRTTGGIEPSDYSFESKTEVVQESEAQSDYFIEDSDDAADFEIEAQDKTESSGNLNVKNILRDSEEKYGSAIRGMISFFTIRKQDIGQQEVDAMERKFYLAPVIGGIFAVILALEMLGMYILGYYLGFPMEVTAVITVATVLIGSKFLHFDGLVDFGDGMVASGNKEKHVAAMKDSKIGAGGFGLALVVVLFTVFLYSYAAWWFLPMFFIIPITEILVKNAMVSAAANGTPGDGMAASQVRNADNDTAIKSAMISAALSFVGLVVIVVLSWVINKIYMHYYDGPWTTPLFSNFGLFFASMFIALIAGILVSMYVGKRMAKVADETFGSTSGDILGATNEIARPVVSVVLLLVFLLMYRVLAFII